MFILYINDLPLVSQLRDFVLFADDTIAVLFYNENSAQLETIVNNKLSNISELF